MKRYINLKVNTLKQKRQPRFSQSFLRTMPKKSFAYSSVLPSNASIKQNNSLFPSDDYYRGQTVAAWVSKRLLQFLNSARNVRDLMDVEEEDNNYSIGKIVAERLLDYRNELPRRRYTTLRQLENIEGFGADKFDDLVQLLGVRADEAFQKNLFNGLLLPNWEVNFYRIQVEDPVEWRQLMVLNDYRKIWLTEKLREFVVFYGNNNLADNLEDFVRNAYLENYQDPTFASIGFAFWWYRIDQDNWFSFDAIRQQIMQYFTHYESNNILFCLIKDFPNYLVLKGALTTPDLPLFFNEAEQSVTIWTVSLND